MYTELKKTEMRKALKNLSNLEKPRDVQFENVYLTEVVLFRFIFGRKTLLKN